MRLKFKQLLNQTDSRTLSNAYVAPDIGNHDDGKEIGHTSMVTNVGAFDIEATLLHAPEHNIP